MKVTHQGKSRYYRTVCFDKERNSVQLIEQRLLPHKFKVVSTADYRETARAITDMIVRGAGAIGAAAAYGLAQGARAFRRGGLKAFERHLAKVRWLKMRRWITRERTPRKNFSVSQRKTRSVSVASSLRTRRLSSNFAGTRKL